VNLCPEEFDVAVMNLSNNGAFPQRKYITWASRLHVLVILVDVCAEVVRTQVLRQVVV
jgi:hypothetical protein